MSHVSYGWPSPSPADRCNDQLQAKTCCAWFCSTCASWLKSGYSMLQHHIWRCTCSFIFHLNHAHFQFTLLSRSWIQTHQMSWSPTRNFMSLFKVQHLTPRQKHQILSVQEMQQLCEAEGLTLQGFRAQVLPLAHAGLQNQKVHRNFMSLRCFIVPIIKSHSHYRLYIALQLFHSTIEDAASFRLHTTLFSACFWQDGQRRHCFSWGEFFFLFW